MRDALRVRTAPTPSRPYFSTHSPTIRPYVRLMSIALTIPDTAALLEAVAMLSEDTRLVDKLWGNVDYLNKVS